jgi:fumarate hydratase subunit beta
MIEKHPAFLRPLLDGGAIYHCGPVMACEKNVWRAVAAGPTTSIREEPYEADVMEHYKVRVIIGKGGMGQKTLEACRKVGAVYVHAVGGAAVLQADWITRVEDVLMLEELGAPEAFWVCRVEGFKGVVTMDANGGSLHDVVLKDTQRKRDALLGL